MILELFAVIKTPMTVVHVIAVVFGMGGALTSDLLFGFFAKDKKLNVTELRVLSILSSAVLTSLVFVVLSGVGLFLSDIPKYSSSVKFLSKMSIMIVLLCNGYILDKYIWSHLLHREFFVSVKEKMVRKIAFACGAISVISWVSACTLGVLDSVSVSYQTLMSLYVAIIVCGVSTALILEDRGFERR